MAGLHDIRHIKLVDFDDGILAVEKNEEDKSEVITFKEVTSPVTNVHVFKDSESGETRMYHVDLVLDTEPYDPSNKHFVKLVEFFDTEYANYPHGKELARVLHTYMHTEKME